MVERKDSDQPCFRTQERCAQEFAAYVFKSFPVSVMLLTAEIFANRDSGQVQHTSGLIQIQTSCHSDGMPERLLGKICEK